ncbi:PilT protein domain-containing protein [Halosimplex carlsbadense 2-9-1]|uniref:Ribonuclease VapC n=1 Tax=Halosimplex carlsbadense 2-9-1 TaxID=797114 RepID=M0CY46_9EURY|nr:PIN domain-containing protein [Halosimplex carlsbadense]ELZ28156.1 PilT protein domain-containing protein [Halosimplex carlsbadense 2-9-1]
MIALDTCFLLDYLDGVDAAAAYLQANEDKPFFAPSLALFELYRGAARTDGREGIERVAAGLDWVEPLGLSEPAAREAALAEAELLETGDRVNLGDALIAGICRHHGARIVTRDSHFDRVDGLDAETY